MRCPNCGTNNQPGTRYCGQCAAPLTGSCTPGRPETGQVPPSVGLVVQGGPEAGRRFTLHAGYNTIGRAPGSDILLSEPSVSRSHARILVQPDGVWIDDVGSTVGTVVNGQRITDLTRLRSGDIVQVGRVASLSVQVSPVTPSVAPAAPQAGAPGTAWPSRRSAQRRRRVLVAGLVSLTVLVLLGIAGLVYVQVLLDSDQYLELPNVGDWSSMSEDEALAIGVSVIEQEYPELLDVTPQVIEKDAQGHHIYDVAFSTREGPEDRGFSRTVIVAIDTENETVSIFESD